MSVFLKFYALIFCVSCFAVYLGESAEAQDRISAIQLLGSNSPAGESYDEPLNLGGDVQLVANDSLSVAARTFDSTSGEYYFETQYSSVSGGFVEDTSENWFANFRLTFESQTENAGTYFWFEDENGPIDLFLNGFTGGNISPHPFDLTIPEVAFLSTTRDPGLEHQFGIFSNPFSLLTNQLSVDPSEVTGIGIGVSLTTAVPEPSTAGLLLTLCIPVMLLRNRSGS